MVRWLNKMPLVHISPSTKIWHLSTEKRTFVEAVGLQHYTAQTQEKSHPGSPNLSLVWEPLKSNDLENHLWMKEPLWKSRISVQKFHHWRKKSNIGDIGVYKKKTVTLPVSPSNKAAQLSAPKPGLRRFHRINILTASQTPLDAGP